MNEPGLITRYLDCGLDGIAFPHVEDAASARRLLEVVRYACPKDHADKIVIVMVETPAAMEKAGEIAAVPGVDVINIGVNDVALAAGFPGQPEHPEVEKLVDQAIGRIRKAGKHVALNVLDNWEPRMSAFQKKGVLWWNVRTRTFLDRGIKQYVGLLNRYGG
jgi:4-hydroxy-2-oxoheptanedioate aldolase